MVGETFNHLIETMIAPLEGGASTAAPAGLLLLGLIAGLRHSIEGDHVAAVSTIVARHEGKLRSAPLLGFLWGLGHTATLLVAGLLLLLLTVSIPENVSISLEFGVGMMLIFLGATTLAGFDVGRFLRGIVRNRERHSHPHIHKETGIVHSHDHDHSDHRHGHSAMIIGMIHGMAGSGALMLVVLSTINSFPLGLAYIAIFGAGSIASMTAMSALIALPFVKAKKYRRVTLLLRYGAAVITFFIGAALVYEMGLLLVQS